MTKAGFLGCSALVAATARAVCAQPASAPEYCQSQEAQTAYRGGQGKADQWWDKIVCQAAPDCCTPELSKAMHDILTQARPTNTHALCETGGFTDRLISRYVGACASDAGGCALGEILGKYYGLTYCAIAASMEQPFEVSSLVQPKGDSGNEQYVSCCTAQFDTTARCFPEGSECPNNAGCIRYLEGEAWGGFYRRAVVRVCGEQPNSAMERGGVSGERKAGKGGKPSHVPPKDRKADRPH
jgi:hypothetical protein